MKTKLFVSLIVVAMLLAVVGVAAAAPAPAPVDAQRIDAIMGDVKSIAGTLLAVQSMERGELQVQTNDRTRFRTKDGADITLADIKVGDRIIARGYWQDGKLVAQAVVLIPANLRDKIGGKVASITGTTIVVTKRDGSTVNVATNAQTKFHTLGNPNATLADVKVGDMLEAVGQLNGDTLTAVQVLFRTPPARTPGPIAVGKIEAINGSTLTLQLGFGETLTVNTSANTFFVKRGEGGAQVITLVDLKVGDGVLVIGPRSSDNSSIDARVIVVGKGGPQPGPQPQPKQEGQPPLQRG
jgi:hypothetical protein